jgi:hypothetical protein
MDSATVTVPPASARERKSPRLGLAIILAVCVPFWGGVWWALL